MYTVDTVTERVVGTVVVSTKYTLIINRQKLFINFAVLIRVKMQIANFNIVN